MPINQWKDRRGRVKIYVSRQWPDGSRFRRVQPNMTVAKKTLARIEEAIAMGTWRELREQLAVGGTTEGVQPTIASFSEVYLEHCETRNTRPDFKVQAFSSINRVVGHAKLSEMSVAHADHFVKVRSQQDGVEPATVNRGLAVLKNMLNFAKRREYIDVNPLTGYEMLPDRERALRILTVNEFRDLVHHVSEADPVIGVYVAVLGEVGLRKEEGIRLQWKDISSSDGKLTVRKSKNHRPRYVRISDFAIEKLASLIRVVGCPQVFVNPHTRTPWKDPRGPFFKGRKAAGLTWVKGFHDLRHFRATQWLMNGVDVRTVQEWLGHRSIVTTMRYVHYVQEHAREAFARAQERELGRLTGRQASDSEILDQATPL